MSASSNPNPKSTTNGSTRQNLGDADELLRPRQPLLGGEEEEEQEELDDDDFDDEFDDDFEQELADEWEELDDVNGVETADGESDDDKIADGDDEAGGAADVDVDADDDF
jgi:hypothetical protein